MLKKEKNIFEINTEAAFKEESVRIFNLQYQENKIYRSWVDSLKLRPDSVTDLHQIPFLPIEFFKNHKVVCGELSPSTIEFTSSATTSQQPSTHFVTDIGIYEKSFSTCFEKFYGPPHNYCILALLPNYLERKGSSLVYMCDKLIKDSNNKNSGFYLKDLDKLTGKINELKRSGQKVLLIGVSYALMDLCDRGIKLSDNFIVMETGGMKGTRKEMLKPELHDYLKKGFGITKIHSEYGMTELLSQAYSQGDGLFRSPPWMRFLTREIDDPLKIRTDSRTGGINVIDLANINSCSFIATKDLGRIHENNALELMGRFDESDVRGCNLMFENL